MVAAAAQARREAAGKPQGKHHVDINLKRGGTGASYRLRRIARLKPDVLERYEGGEFPSVDVPMGWVRSRCMELISTQDMII